MRPITDNDIERLRRAYNQHRNDTKGRVDKAQQPIEFRLSFDEWLSIWLESGVWHLRGQGRNHYVMSRYNDLGHYEVGNVFIQRKGDNTREAHCGRVVSLETRAKTSAANHKRFGTQPFVGPKKPLVPDSAEVRLLKQREQYQWHQAQHVYKVQLDADRQRVIDFYLNCPDGMVVDHITPMSLGGAHVLENLQYLDWQASRRKGRLLRSA